MGNYYQKEIETASREEILRIQNEKIVRQVKYVYENVPYYRIEPKAVTKDNLDEEIIDSGFHRSAVRIHHRAERPHRRDHFRRAHPIEPLMEPSAMHQVQRHQLYLATCGRSHLHSSRQKGSQGHYPLLHAERHKDAAHIQRTRYGGLWWGKRPVYMGTHSKWHQFVGIFRGVASRSTRGLHPRCGFRS